MVEESLDFVLFKETFTNYQKLFGLTGYKVYFKYEPIDKDCYADITTNQNSMVATVRLNSDGKDEFRNVKQSAKHEAIHLLLYRLEHLTISRFLHEEEESEAVEELVFKLEGLII